MRRKDGKHVGWIYEYECIDESLEWFGWNYVGQTRAKGGVKSRDIGHKRKDQHILTLFDRTYQKHPEAFQLNVVDEYVCDTEQELVDTLNEMETYYIRLFASYIDWGSGFNLTTGGGECVVCEETRRKLSEKSKEYNNLPEVKHRQSVIAKKMWGDESYREYQTKKNQEINNSPITRGKISKSLKEKYNDPAYKDRMMTSWIENGKKDGFVEKMTRINREILSRPEVIEKLSEASKRYFADINNRVKMSVKIQNVWNSEGYRERLSKSHIGKTVKKCQLLDLENGFIHDYDSVKSACEFLSIPKSSIYNYRRNPYRGRWLFIPSTECA